MKQLAIIGPTSSGKSDLAYNLAHEFNSVILSIDSLSIYKEIDIASAKPDKIMLNSVKHFGIDEFYPNEYFSVSIFLKLYEKSVEYAKNHNKNLIIVGGSGFYLKTLIDGLSDFEIDNEIKSKVEKMVSNLHESYTFLKSIDEQYASKIASNDRYRVQKALEIYFSTNKTPSNFFLENQKKSLIEEIDIFEIEVDKDELLKRVQIRTQKMFHDGLIDEVYFLEKKYGRDIAPLKAIGIKESLDYLDGIVDKNRLLEQIITHTMQLAKRQKTFNKSQFVTKKEKLNILKDIIIDCFNQKEVYK
ncbi:MAG: tRNA (adenosine(37)-N6)-dimethylallyltransferase MiaA [Campylobacterales bacterium]|nr:tRNA (adenosine(37)-N6)-dimethylallyltransferase MiaA [Campylobacterales bacterium]